MKKTYALILVLLFSSTLSAQDYIPQVVPPSPNAAKLAQFDITPTSPYTGKQNLSVPLYNIDFDGVQFPISINYASGGVKTSEEASYVGLGWALSFGGTISRTLKSLNDIRGQGWLFDDESMPETVDYTVPGGQLDGQSLTQHPFWTYVSGGQKDTEPDVFNYNFMGYNGSFVLPKGHGDGYNVNSDSASTSDVVKLEQDPTKIYFDNPGKFFTITTPDGFVGEFKVKEWVTSLGGSAQGSTSGCAFGQIDILQIMNDHKRAITTWYLSKVISPNGRELHFEYDIKTNGYSDYMSQSAPYYGEMKSVSGSWQQVTEEVQACSYTVVEEVYPKRIYSSYNGLDINFNKSQRNDLAPMAPDYHTDFAQERGELNGSNQPTFSILSPQRITGFTVGSTNALSSLNHTISFSQTYFNDNETDAYQMKRLKLDGVTVDDQVYSFEYENGTNGLPDKSTFAVDYWGFYNGKTSNTSLIPVTTGYSNVSRFYGPNVNTYLPNDLYYYQSDARKADFDYGKAGILKKVTYPTGGHTIYEYESHNYKLEGQEVVPVTGNINENANGSSDYSAAGTDQSDNFQYQGYFLDVGSCTSKVTVNFSISCKEWFNGGTCQLSSSVNSIVALSIVNISNSQNAFQKTFGELVTNMNNTPPTYRYNGSVSISLPPGTYYLKATSIATDDNKYARGEISVQYPASCSSTSQATIVQHALDQNAGGARIKTISNYDGTGSIVAKRSYDYLDYDGGTQFSTGKLMNPLMNFSVASQGGATSFHAFRSNSALSNGGAAQGSHIGYTWVREHFEGATSGDIGFRDYNYLNEPNLPGYYGLSAKSTYKSSNGQMDNEYNYNSTAQRLTKTDYDDIVEDLNLDVKAVKVDWTGNDPGIMETYSLKRQFITPKEIISETYLTGGTLSQTVTKTYNNQYLLKSETNTNSNGNVVVKEYKYASDISGPAGVVLGMVNGNFINAPIEQTTKVNGIVESASGTLYQQVGNNYLPDKIHVFNTDAGSFSPTTTGLSFGGGYEERIEFTLYDGNGNIREFVNEAGVSTTILWGYGSVYPVAQIENATYAEISPLISQATLDSPGSHANMRNALNALRNNAAMKNARITTMTYDLGVGMLSQTSPNGITMFYEYDTYGRLRRIIDQDDNIIKVVEYAYKQIIPNIQQN